MCPASRQTVALACAHRILQCSWCLSQLAASPSSSQGAMGESLQAVTALLPSCVSLLRVNLLVVGAGTAEDTFGQVATDSGAESLQPHLKSSEPERESPALAAVDRNLELGLDAPASKEADPLEDGEDDDDWGEEGQEIGDEDLEAELGLDDEDEDLDSEAH